MIEICQSNGSLDTCTGELGDKGSEQEATRGEAR